MPLQAAGNLRRRRPRMADQGQQHRDDDRCFRRGPGRAHAVRVEARLAPAPLGVADSGVVGKIDPDTGHALPAQGPLAHRGQQERLHAHLQPGLQFLVGAAGRGLADEAAREALPSAACSWGRVTGEGEASRAASMSGVRLAMTTRPAWGFGEIGILY